MLSLIISCWYALASNAAVLTSPVVQPRVVYAETDGWHYIVAKNETYVVIQSALPNQFVVGDQLLALAERHGEQWVLINSTPRRTTVWVNEIALSYSEAVTLTKSHATNIVASK